MPRIIVTSDWPAGIVMLSERISVADLESDHFRAQLLERLSWAVSDAHATEQARRLDEPDRATPSAADSADQARALAHTRRWGAVNEAATTGNVASRSGELASNRRTSAPDRLT
jgi:hypothetical protein